MDSSDDNIQLTPFMEELLSIAVKTPSENEDTPSLLDGVYKNCTLIGYHFYIDTVSVYLETKLAKHKQVFIQPDPDKIVYNSHPMKFPRIGYLVKNVTINGSLIYNQFIF